MWTPDPESIITADQKAAAALAALLGQFEAAIQAHIDATAQSRRYKDGFALAGYATSTVLQFAAEAAAFVAWRDAVWIYAYGELARVEAQDRPIPSIEDFLGELPVISWPE